MPQKRRQRRNVNKTKKIDPDASILADSENPKELQRETIIRDFDVQVSTRIRAMEVQMKAMQTDITRLFASSKMNIKKEIKQMTKKEFLAKGGNWKLLNFTPIINTLTDDMSFQDTPVKENIENTVIAPGTVKKTVASSLRKKNATMVDSPLLQDAPLTRTKAGGRGRKIGNMVTPMTGGKKPFKTPLVAPKFDVRKPLTVAREPKNGETLMSLAGSPVLSNSLSLSDDSNVVSLVLNKQQTLLGGSLFDMTMSPNTLMTSKERLQEALTKINSRMEDLDMQISGQSKLNVS